MKPVILYKHILKPGAWVEWNKGYKAENNSDKYVVVHFEQLDVPRKRKKKVKKK